MWSFKSHPPLVPVSLFGRRQCSYLTVKRIQRQYREIKKVKWGFIFARIHSEEEWVDRWGEAVLRVFHFVLFWWASYEVHINEGGLPGSSIRKESACNATVPGSIPELGRFPRGGHGNPLQYSCLEIPHGQMNLAGYSP